MKKVYKSPKLICINVDTTEKLLSESYVEMGGKGYFDVREQRTFEDESTAPSGKNIWQDQW